MYTCLNNIGNILIRMSKFDEAVPYFEQAIDMNPSFEKPYLNLNIIIKNIN